MHSPLKFPQYQQNNQPTHIESFFSPTSHTSAQFSDTYNPSNHYHHHQHHQQFQPPNPTSSRSKLYQPQSTIIMKQRYGRSPIGLFTTFKVQLLIALSKLANQNNQNLSNNCKDVIPTLTLPPTHNSTQMKHEILKKSHKTQFEENLVTLHEYYHQQSNPPTTSSNIIPTLS